MNELVRGTQQNQLPSVHTSFIITTVSEYDVYTATMLTFTRIYIFLCVCIVCVVLASTAAVLLLL